MLFDPSQIIMIFKGVPLTGYADGSFVEATRAVDLFTMKVGSDGSVVWVRSPNKSGTVTMTLQRASPSNLILSGFLKQDELLGTGKGELLVKDLNGASLVVSPSARITKVPDFGAAGDDYGNNAWVIGCPILEIFHGGSTP